MDAISRGEASSPINWYCDFGKADHWIRDIDRYTRMYVVSSVYVCLILFLGQTRRRFSLCQIDTSPDSSFVNDPIAKLHRNLDYPSSFNDCFQTISKRWFSKKPLEPPKLPKDIVLCRLTVWTAGPSWKAQSSGAKTRNRHFHQHYSFFVISSIFTPCYSFSGHRAWGQYKL